MSTQTTYDLIIGAVVLALLVYRQLRARPVSQSRQMLGLVLAVIGVVETVNYVGKVHAGTTVVAALAGSLVLAAGFGVARAATVRIWLQDGQPWSQGNWLTAGLWVIAVAAHLGFDALVGSHKGLSGLGTATIVLYLAVSLLVQYAVVSYRAQRLSSEPVGKPGSLV